MLADGSTAICIFQEPKKLLDSLTKFRTSDFKFTTDQLARMLSYGSFTAHFSNNPELIFDSIMHFQKLGFENQTSTTLLCNSAFSSCLDNVEFRNYVSYLSKLYFRFAEFRCLHTFLYAHFAPNFDKVGFLDFLNVIRSSFPVEVRGFHFFTFLKCTKKENVCIYFKHPQNQFSMWKVIKEWYLDEQNFPSFSHFMTVVIQYAQTDVENWKRLLATILDTQENVLSLYKCFMKLQSKVPSSSQIRYFTFLTALRTAKEKNGFNLGTFVEKYVPPGVPIAIPR